MSTPIVTPSLSRPMAAPAGLAMLPAATVTLSAFLLFSVQPMIGRLLLPLFGGSASVWSACMLFFQAVLLVGYAYADVTSRRLTPKAQATLHALLLLAGAVCLPIGLRADFGASLPPALGVGAILTASVGLPYFLLSATGPLVQVWYVRMTGAQPYRIYALSNFASMLALLSYPTLIEPNLKTSSQLAIWSGVFLAFALCCGALGLSARHARPVSVKEVADAATPSAGRRILWVVLAAIPSAMLLATTNHISQDVAAVPFLWIIPLSVYLLTLILCFDVTSPGFRNAFRWITPPALGAMAYAATRSSLVEDPRLLVAMFAFGLFAACMSFHGELVERKPASAHLTSFYLMISLGGAMGSALVAWVAPAVLRGVFELPILLVVSTLFLLFLYYGRGPMSDVAWAGAAVAVLVYCGAVILALSANATTAVRNFYGAIRIVEDGKFRSMVHGTVTHGAQYLDPAKKNRPTLYYAPGTGAQFALETLRKGRQNVGVVGLGAGAVAAYSQPGDHYTFYELNPQVIDLARRDFPFLSTPGVETVVGDGRLSLAKTTQTFDVLLIDAFSGDAIPTHLLTIEAMQLYLSRLGQDGVLGIHISNSVLALEGVVERLAAASGLAAVLVNSSSDASIHRSESSWALMARGASRLQHPALDAAARPLRARAGQRLWTDDYSDLFHSLRAVGAR